MSNPKKPGLEKLTNSRSKMLSAAAVLLLSPLALLSTHSALAQKKSAPAAKSAPAPRASAPAAKSTSSSGAKTGSSGGASHTASSGAGSKTAAGGAAGGKGNTGSGSKAASNVKAPPGGKVTETKNGVVAKNSAGKVTEFKGNNGHEAKFGSNGKVKEVKAGNMTISHGPGNMRRSVVENRETHTRFVAEGHGRGYIEHRYEYGGHAYYARGYYYHGGYYRNYYHPYYYGGVQLYGYAPAYFYPTAYYGWAYNPWPAPAPYAWGWGGAPWYGYYGAYFNPYPVYPAPNYWLADYMIAATLQAAFIANAENANVHMPELPAGPQFVLASYSVARHGGANAMLAAADAGSAPALSTEVKKSIADEIQLDLAAEKAKPASADGAAVGNLGTLLADNKPHVFVAGAAITATSGSQDCSITEGDVLSLPSAPAKDAESANLTVLASKSTDCAKSNTVAVQLTDLQDMYNHLLTNIDKGLGEMKDNPGKGGIPAPPADATAGSKEAPYVAAAPAPEKNGSAELDAQATEAAKTEQQVLAEANEADGSGGAVASGGSAGTAPGNAVAPPSKMETITLGQTIAEVVAMKGQPKNILNFAAKQIYVYPDMKITFVKGKISDVN